MGRGTGKVTLKHIQDEKVRKAAFIHRNKGLTKKVFEFSKNFGVQACLIVYDGDGDGDGKPMIWPQDSKTLHSVLTKYEQKNETTPKIFDAKDYFANKKNEVEAQILKVRKNIMMKKYPTWGRCFSILEEEQLKGFIDIVDIKIEACNERIAMLKSMQQNDQTSFMQNTTCMPNNIVSPQACQPDDTTEPPLININEMMDCSDLIDWDDPMPQNNVFSSHSSELDVVMHSIIPQMQSISPPLKSLGNISLPPVSSTKQLDDNITKPLTNINEMIDINDLIDWDDLMPHQNNVFSSHSSELDVMHSSIPQMQPISISAPLKSLDNISMPQVSSTKQLDEFVKLDDLMESDQDWANQLVDLDDWAANKLDDENDSDGIVNWVRQPNMYEWQDMSFSSEIEEQCAALDVFSQPRYEF